MARAGDRYEVELKEAHLDWGRYRYTNTRDKIPGEGYVQIPKHWAEAFDIRVGDKFNASFEDGFPSFVARASGNTRKGDVWAKQFQGDRNLKAFGRWYESVGADVGDLVIVTFLAADEVHFELVHR